VRLCDVCGDPAPCRLTVDEHPSKYRTLVEEYELDLCVKDADLLAQRAWGELGRRRAACEARNVEQVFGLLPPSPRPRAAGQEPG
jgi:hypothetical protein